jgi:superfamily II DNA helicase RecQ
MNRLAEARSHGSNLWELVHEHVTMLCLSPEQLASKGFSDLLEHKPFSDQFCALGVDEIHLLYHWGLSFQVTLLQIEHDRACCPANVVTCALSATVAKGHVMDNVCKFLGFKEGQFHLIRCLND